MSVYFTILKISVKINQIEYKMIKCKDGNIVLCNVF